MIQEFFTARENASFVWALIILFAASLLLVVASLAGVLSLPEVDADLEVDWSDNSLGSSLLEFLGIAAMPLSIFMLVGTCTFFVSGYTIQMTAQSLRGAFLPGWIAIAPSILITIFGLRSVGKLFAKSKFRLHTTAVTSQSFLFKLVTISQGTARVGLAAEAKLVDEHGLTHYVLVEPKESSDIFLPGSEVVLVEQVGSKFLAVSASVEDILGTEHQTTKT